MRTAVVRVDVDPSGQLTPAQLRAGMATLLSFTYESGVEALDNNIEAMPAHRREVQLLITGDDLEAMKATAAQSCADAFGTAPTVGVVTYVSRGTDDDAYGVLAGFGLSAEVQRSPGGDGLDVVQVAVRKKDLERVPESRIQTALEASLNCEVRIVAS